ncbi:type IX secretion system sortase PorU [bacterium]|nr:type IX secretion system sortase PorU [bacterium]
MKHFILLYILAASTSMQANHAILHQADDNGCQFEINFKDMKWDTLTMESQTYHRLCFSEAQYCLNPGDPMLPGRSVIIAVPPEASLEVNASLSAHQIYNNINMLPCPEMEKTNGFYEEKYVQGKVYQKAGYQPQTFIQKSAPSYMGDLRVVYLRIVPVQYDPVTQTARLYSRISVHVQFLGGAIPQGRPGQTENVAWIDRLILNADQAKQWLRRPQILKKYQQTFGSGSWYKIPVSEDNIYRISGKKLQEEGVELSSVDVSKIKIYNNSGRMLPRGLHEDRPDALIEIPIFIQGGEDDRLDENDAILFFGEDVQGWSYDSTTGFYSHYVHLYDTQNIYWLRMNGENVGKRVTQKASIDGTASQTVTQTPAFYFYEKDKINPIHAGIQWYAEEFTEAIQEIGYQVDLNNPVAPDVLSLAVQVKGGSTASHKFSFDLNGMILPTISLNGRTSKSQRMTLSVEDMNVSNTFKVKYKGGKNSAIAYLDWFEIIYHRTLKASSDRLLFVSPDQAGVYTYQLGSFSGRPQVWDVTDPEKVQSFTVEQDGSVWQFVDQVDLRSPKRYIAFHPESAVSVADIIEDNYVSDLRNPSNRADMIIITPQVFIEQADRLKQMREKYDALSVKVVDIQDVYDEFGWGLTDPTAIRDFMICAWAWEKRPQYLLLFGDGTYIYKDSNENDLKNWIPPYELDEDDEEMASAVDDWYVRVSGDDSEPDLAIGRLPVQTEEEARLIVNKIIQYETENHFGLWRTVITLLSDDVRKGSEQNLSSEKTHTEASESLAAYTIPPHMNIRKIYLTEYEEVIQTDGRRKPGAKADLFEQINLGTVMVNYIGHGNENVWAHEQALLQPGDLELFVNPEKLPLMYGATCTFARFDFEDQQSLAENVLLIEGGGSIASIGATRSCFADQNEALNKSFIDEILNSQSVPRLGEALRLAKIINSSGGTISNNQKYVLLGDPALRLALPEKRIMLTEMEPDTFKALSIVKVQAGFDTTESDFQGTALLTAYDSKKQKTFTFNTSQQEYQLFYQIPGNVLFRGQATVTQGKLNTSFVVPKDISYGQHHGRISLYAYNDELDAAGYRDDIPVGGSASISDAEGPEIFLSFTENPHFITGGIVPSDPELVAEIEDRKTGVNIAGEIGHKLTLTLDDQDQQDVSAYFQYDQDSYLKGRLSYRLSNLEEGLHRLSLKAWDNANNSSTADLIFQIIPRGEMCLQEVLNYPNPFSTYTHFTFQVSHAADIEIKVYTVDGRMIRRIEGIWAEPGFNMIEWNGRDDVGDSLSNGVYLYKVDASANIDGKRVKVSKMNKLMVYR